MQAGIKTSCKERKNSLRFKNKIFQIIIQTCTTAYDDCFDVNLPAEWNDLKLMNFLL